LHIPSHPNIWIARVIGIIAIASGFVLGIEGLNQPDSIWLPTALGLILTGLCAQGYAFYRTITEKMHPQDKKDS
jgi:quinol-cytochrome oxidoreductase complex cytochrome b subunit